jgi:hypothetical protein
MRRSEKNICWFEETRLHEWINPEPVNTYGKNAYTVYYQKRGEGFF